MIWKSFNKISIQKANIQHKESKTSIKNNRIEPFARVPVKILKHLYYKKDDENIYNIVVFLGLTPETENEDLEKLKNKIEEYYEKGYLKISDIVEIYYSPLKLVPTFEGKKFIKEKKIFI